MPPHPTPISISIPIPSRIVLPSHSSSAPQCSTPRIIVAVWMPLKYSNEHTLETQQMVYIHGPVLGKPCPGFAIRPSPESITVWYGDLHWIGKYVAVPNQRAFPLSHRRLGYRITKRIIDGWSNIVVGLTQSLSRPSPSPSPSILLAGLSKTRLVDNTGYCVVFALSRCPST